jgi:hypothetical protein
VSSGFLDFSGVEPLFPQWQAATQGWVNRARRGAGVSGGIENAKTIYFYGSGFYPFGRTWGGKFAPSEICDSTPEPTPNPSPDCKVHGKQTPPPECLPSPTPEASPSSALPSLAPRRRRFVTRVRRSRASDRGPTPKRL